MTLSTVCHSFWPEHSTIDALSDEEIRALIRERGIHNLVQHPSGDSSLDSLITPVYRITADAVAKFTSSPTEAFMMEYVSVHTSIPVPKLRRAIPNTPDLEVNREGTWLIMDYIEGELLQTALHKLSWWQQYRLMCSIRQYIMELQRTVLPNPDRPGPFDETEAAYSCTGFYFTEGGAGPFDTYADMVAWYNRLRFDCLASSHFRFQGIPHIPKFTTSSHPLVLCHMDLNVRNIIVDRDGRLWLIDWANSGAFPAYLEYAQFTHWGVEPDVKHVMRPPRLWKWFSSFMFGNYGKFKKRFLDGQLRACWRERTRYQFPDDYFEQRGIGID